LEHFNFVSNFILSLTNNKKYHKTIPIDQEKYYVKIESILQHNTEFVKIYLTILCVMSITLSVYYKVPLIQQYKYFYGKIVIT